MLRVCKCKKAVLFYLSNSDIQFKFKDGSELMFDRIVEQYQYIDTEGEKFQYGFDSIERGEVSGESMSKFKYVKELMEKNSTFKKTAKKGSKTRKNEILFHRGNQMGIEPEFQDEDKKERKR